MDKIFREIKQAIEEEMARQEGRPSGGSRPPQSRDMSQYETWLQQEQDRLRGSGAPSELEERQVESLYTVVEERPRRARDRQDRDQRRRERQERRDRDTTQAAERASQVQPERTERTTQHQRSEARHERRARSAYERRGRTDLATSLSRMLRSRRGMQQAFLLSEVVRKPVSLRSQDHHLIS
jgi:hypothetical protein